MLAYLFSRHAQSQEDYAMAYGFLSKLSPRFEPPDDLKTFVDLNHHFFLTKIVWHKNLRTVVIVRIHPQHSFN